MPIVEKICLLSKTALNLGIAIRGWTNPVAIAGSALLEDAADLLAHRDVDPTLEEQYYKAVEQTLSRLEDKFSAQHSMRTLINELTSNVDLLDTFDTDLDTVVRKAETYREQYMNDIDAQAFIRAFDRIFPEEIARHDELSHFYNSQDNQRMFQILEQILQRLDQTQVPEPKQEPPCLKLPLVSALPASKFVGRVSELKEISDRFAQGDKLVVLTGLGGMGKTELAVKFGRVYGGTVYFARFDVSFTKTLANMAHGIRPALSDEELRQPEEVLCAMVFELLSKADKNDLLIIDNADTGSLADLCQALLRLPSKVLLTTRSDWDEGIFVEKIEDEHLRKMLTRYGANLTVEEMDAIIKTVNGHTLTIDLIARTLNGKGLKKVTAEMMIESLKKNTLPSEKYRKIATHYNQSTEQAQIYQHLSTVFNVSEISDDDKELLRCATLFPENGISGDLMAGIMNDDGIAHLESLMERGWLEMKDGLLTIHPVIRLVCRTELTPTDENCGAFLDALWGQFDEKEYDRIKYAQLAEVFALAAEYLDDQKAEWINRSGCLLNDLAQYGAARDLYEKHLPSLEKRLKDTEQLATVYNNLGYAYGGLGDHRKALEFMLKALGIREKVLPPEHPDLAKSYNNVGLTYGDLGDHSKALEFQLKALKIQEKVLPPEHPDLATSYNNVGVTYSAMGDHKKALEFKLKALEIRENVLPPEHPHLATSYNNVGHTYGELGDHSKALEFQLKALEIREKVLPPEHPDLAISYSSVSCTYSELGDTEKDLEYGLKALKIQEKVLPPEHPSLATSYNNVGITYAYMEDFPKAVEYVEKALAIREKVLPPTHPYIASTKQSIANIRSAMDRAKKSQ